MIKAESKQVTEQIEATKFEKIIALLSEREHDINAISKGEITINFGNGNINCEVTLKSRASYSETNN